MSNIKFDTVLELEPPHGFLMSQEKQTAIARIDPLDIDRSHLIISNGEAFGVAEFDKPAQIKTKDFDSNEWFDQHRVTPRERRQWWRDAETFYVYRLKSWQPFEGVKLFEDGEVRDEPELTAEQRRIISKAKDLPKRIEIIPDAVSITDKQEFLIYPPVDGAELLNILAAAFDTEIKQANEQWDEVIDLYSLALVRNPRMGVSKKNQKQEDDIMPYRIRKRDDEYCVVKINADDSDGDTEDCHDTRDEAEAQLTALNINVTSQEKNIISSDGSLDQQLDFIRQQFDVEFNPSEESMEKNSYGWVTDIFDSFVIAEFEGRLFRVDYMMLEDSIMFAPEERWVEVERAYMPKGFKRLWSKSDNVGIGETPGKVLNVEGEEKKPESKVAFMDRLKLAAKNILDIITLAETPETDEGLFKTPTGIGQKQVGGELWHFAWATNAFEDREEEIFSTKALENYVKEAEEKGSRGVFNLWHINEEDGNFNTDFANIEWQGVVGRILIEAGPYLDDFKGQAAQKFFSAHPDGHPEYAPEGWGSSPEYLYLPEERVTGVYDWIWKTRTSTLPRAAAANIFTKSNQLDRGNKMALSEQQKKLAVELFGDEFVTTMIQDAEGKTAELEAAGVAHKEKSTETPLPTQPKEIEIDMEALAEQVGKQFAANLNPVTEAIASIEERFKAVEERISQVEESDKAKAITESPRFIFNMQRASESKKTTVTEDDELINQKPSEAKAGNNDPWSQMFNKQ